MPQIENCTVVIRSVGERTEKMCYRLLEGIFPSEQVKVISDTPFAATLRKSLQYGIAQNRQWTLCIDADVLVEQKALRALFERSCTFDDAYFEFHGFIADKFFEDIRPAGNHLYRTKHLQQAIDMIPDEGISLRPETYMLKAMERRGIKHKYFPDLTVGLHDFEQYHRDIFNKGFLHAHKHIRHLSKLLPRWKELAKTDTDFKVLLWGVGSGIANEGEGYADKSKTPFHLFESYSKELPEKGILEEKMVTPNDIIKTINSSMYKSVDTTPKTHDFFNKLRGWIR
jgi:hypothetical protein